MSATELNRRTAHRRDKGKGGFCSQEVYNDYKYAQNLGRHTTTAHSCASRTRRKSVRQTYEVNIFDQRQDRVGTGAIVDFAKVSPMPKAGGKWNTFLITAKGTNLIVVMNGVETVNVNDSKYASGPFALQFGNLPKEPGGAIKWRKVQVREL